MLGHAAPDSRVAWEYQAYRRVGSDRRMHSRLKGHLAVVRIGNRQRHLVAQSRVQRESGSQPDAQNSAGSRRLTSRASRNR